MNEIQYVAGVCNIGRAEITRRRALGWIGLLAALVLEIGLLWAGAARLWRVTVFVPAFLSASGFLQARSRFCSGYAARGVYNFGPPGQTRAVPDMSARRIDQAKGNRILLTAVFAAALATLLATAIA